MPPLPPIIYMPMVPSMAPPTTPTRSVVQWWHPLNTATIRSPKPPSLVKNPSRLTSTSISSPTSCPPTRSINPSSPSVASSLLGPTRLPPPPIPPAPSSRPSPATLARTRSKSVHGRTSVGATISYPPHQRPPRYFMGGMGGATIGSTLLRNQFHPHLIALPSSVADLQCVPAL